MAKKTRRSAARYPALDPHLNLKTRFEELDFDYVDKLPDTWVDPKTGKKWNPKQFLNDFANEHIHADFKSNEKRIHRKKKVENPRNKDLKELLKTLTGNIKDMITLLKNSNVQTKTKLKVKKSLNQTKTKIKKQILEDLSFIEDYYKKEAEDKNNSRNRCILTRLKAQGKAIGIDDLSEQYASKQFPEDEIIDKIDELKLMEQLEKTDGTGDDS